MALRNSGRCEYFGETETIEQFLINCKGNGVDRNVKKACKNYNIFFSIKSVLNVILPNVNRKI